jgi:molybdate transport system substrate-binding protein
VRRPPRAGVLGVFGLLAVLAAACGADAPPPAGSGPGGSAASAGPLDGEVLVFAAASLTEAFPEVARGFGREQPGVTVTFNFGPSSGLAASIAEGAPADVFASADDAQMEEVVGSGAAAEAAVFARNRLEIVVPPGNPGGVEGLGDFARAGLLIGLCAEQVPCGDLARRVLARAGVTPAVDTDEPDVRALLTKVRAGELDAGIVYRTDVRGAGATVTGIAIPDRDNVVVSLPIAPLTDAPHPEAATAFVRYVRGDEGQAILASFGFLGV